jgi:hypothetical protein
MSLSITFVPPLPGYKNDRNYFNDITGLYTCQLKSNVATFCPAPHIKEVSETSTILTILKPWLCTEIYSGNK